MTAGEEDYPPPLPRHRRPLSEPPDPLLIRRDSGYPAEAGPPDDPALADPGVHGEQGIEPDGYYTSGDDGGNVAPWFDSADDLPTADRRGRSTAGDVPSLRSTGRVPSINHPDEGLARPRMPGAPPPFTPPGDSVPTMGSPTGHHQIEDHAAGGHPDLASNLDERGAGVGTAARTGRPNPLDGLRSGPIPVIAAALALVFAAGLIGWMFRGSGGGQEITIGDTADAGDTDGQNGESDNAADAELPPLSPATLPATNENGLVGLELALIDPYTGTGSTGTVELYLNSVTGQVCHLFDAPALSGRYRAYIHEAEFPKAGPIVVDLGEVANSVPRCVNASPIELGRALAGGETFYVAAHAGDQEIVLRAQLSSAATVFDNRDAALVASQQAAAGTNSGGGDGLFGSDDGAYLVVESGRVTFEGMVPDQQTADSLRAAFIALSGMGVEVVDNLMVQAGAPAPSGKVIVADALLFGSGQDQISGDPAVLSTLADLMIVNPSWTMTITGHTDDVGPYSFNIELSLRRANNIRDRLAELGVPAERVRVQGAGPEQPIADNSTDEGRSQNRRIEISIDS